MTKYETNICSVSHDCFAESNCNKLMIELEYEVGALQSAFPQNNFKKYIYLVFIYLFLMKIAVS